MGILRIAKANAIIKLLITFKYIDVY